MTTMTITMITMTTKTGIMKLTQIISLGIYSLFGLNIEYIEQGMLFALDKDLFVIDLCTNKGLISSPITFILIYIVSILSILILLMEGASSSQVPAQTTQPIQATGSNDNRRIKPTINIVYSIVTLDKNYFFIYNKNDGPSQDSVSPLTSIARSRLRQATLQVEGRTYNGIIRKFMPTTADYGCHLPVKPTAYRALVETHNLESNGRNLICRAGSVIIYRDN